MSDIICFECNATFDSMKLLFLHFKQKHGLGSYSTYRCKISFCGQSFQNLGSFKKHLMRVHNLEDNVKIPKSNINFQSVEVKQQNEMHDGFQKDTELNSTNAIQNYDNFSKIFDYQKSMTELLHCAVKFIIDLHNNNNFSRKDIIQIKTSVENNVLIPIMNMFKMYFQLKMKEINMEIYNEVTNLILDCQNIFKDCSSEYKLFQWLKKNNYSVDLKEFNIDSQIGNSFKNGIFGYDEIKARGVLMPLRFQFQKFFEQNNLLKETLQNIEDLKKEKHLKNFVQGELWKKKTAMYPGKILIPFFLYADDIEINNPLGAHAGVQSVCNIYYSFPCLPRKESNLKNIFLAATILSSNFKLHGNEKCLKQLLIELKYLETEGIDIKIDDRYLKVNFVLGLFLGDNLALNSLLGFNKSFNSKSFCRFCKGTKTETQNMFAENNDLIRTYQNYDEDLITNDPSRTGIVSDSIFNILPSFHVVENYSVDVMHDIFEGVCHYNMCHIIIYYTEKIQYFSLELLNHRKKTFDYGPIEIENISGEIKISHLQNKHLKMSAREMMTFVMIFPLLVGDCVPYDDEVWHFLLNFIEIIEILLHFEIDESQVSILKQKIELNNQNFVLLFKDTLKPKFHNLTHYPSVIKQSGPLRTFWCFKFEAKHRPFKVYSHAITSRRNICLTLAKKYQLKFAHYLLNDTYQVLDYEIDENHLTETGFKNLILKKLKETSDNINVYKTVSYRGYLYKTGYYVFRFKNDFECFLIINVILNKTKRLFLFCQKINNIAYNPHFLSYEFDSKNLGEFSILEIKDVVGPPVNANETVKGMTMIRIKDYYFST